MPLAEGLSRLENFSDPTRPVVMADFLDYPGSGGYGDCTAMLAALLDAGICNAAAPAELTQARTGATVTLDLGCKTDLSVGSGPLAISDGQFRNEGPGCPAPQACPWLCRCKALNLW